MKNKPLIVIGIIFFLVFLFILFEPDFVKISGKQTQPTCDEAGGVCMEKQCHLYASYSASERCEAISASCATGACCTKTSTGEPACIELAPCLSAGGRCMKKPCYLYTGENCNSINAICGTDEYCCSAVEGEYACSEPGCISSGGLCKPSDCSNYFDCCSVSAQTCYSNQFCCSGSCCPTKASNPMLNIEGEVPSCFNSSTINNIYGKISFNLGADWWLPANETKMNLTVFNINLITSKIISLKILMNNAIPEINPINLIVGDKLYPSYDSCNNNILATEYTINLEAFGFKFPAAGEYNYKISGHFIDENGGELKQEIYNGKFTVVNNCSLGLGVVTFQKSGGGNQFKNKDKIKCSAVVSGKFFSDLTKSPHILNFTLNYFNGNKFLVYKEFISNKEGSGIKCLNNNCYIEQNIYESHLGDWRCDVAVNDGTEWKYTKYSNNITMINYPPIWGRVIPNKTWETKKNYTSAYNLNDYFFDLDNDVLKYFVDNNYHIIVNISDSGSVNLYQWPPEFIGNESIKFVADDGINMTWSNIVFLNVVGNISDINCTINWSCENYGECQLGNKSYCNFSIDLNDCGLAYAGNYSEFNPQSCIYTPVPPLITQPEALEEKPTEKAPVEVPAEQEKVKKYIILGGVILGVLLLMIILIILIKSKGKEIDIFSKALDKIKKLKGVKVAPVTKPISEKPAVKKVEPKMELVNIKDLKKYIQGMIKKGGDINEIKNKLIKAGWNKKDVDEIIKLVILENFVNKKLEGGLSKEKIKEILLNKKWDEDLIKKVLK